MATQDISRAAFDPRKQYAGVRMQQGRVILDDDWNENESITNEDLRDSRVEIIGPAGSQDLGFHISNPRITAQGIDFDIHPGTMYLGGLRLELHQPQTFRLQGDVLQSPGPGGTSPGGDRTDLVVLITYQQPVSAVEDNELFEVALGGPDTTTRLRTMRRVMLWENVNGHDCETAWQATLKQLAGTLTDGNELASDANLTVTFATLGAPGDLCTSTAAGGYLGAENQAIRVQLVDGTHFTWGFNNAAPLYRVQAAADRRTLTMLTEPKDQAQWPLAKQIVEVLPWAAVLSNNEKVAEMHGYLTRVDTSYNPDTGDLDTGGTLTLVDPIPTDGFDDWTARADAAQLGLGDTYYYLRVWDRGSDCTSLPEIPFTPGIAVPLGNTGLEITFSGTQFRTADYWIIAARPETPQRIVPWQLESGRPPHGLRMFATPLAVIQWRVQDDKLNADVQDCRPHFPPLTNITAKDVSFDNNLCQMSNAKTVQDALDILCQQDGGKCTLTATPGEGWESIFARIAPGQNAQVCFPAGEYLTRNVVLVQNKGHLLITGIGSGTKFVAKATESALAFKGCASVSVRDIAAEAQVTGSKGVREHLNGVLTFVNCPKVSVEETTLQCAAGTRRAATCITVRINENSTQHTQVRINHNDLRIGHEQTGILLVNVARSHIEDNTLTVVKKPKSMTLEKMLRDNYVRAAVRRLLINDIRVTESQIAALETTSEPVHVIKLGNSNLSFRANRATMASDLGKLLVASTPDPSAFVTSADLIRHTKQVIDHALSHPEMLPGRVYEWYKDLHAQNPAVASQGIVIGGQTAEDVRILNNTIYGVRQGIHVGQSRSLAQRTAGRVDRTERLQITGNTITVLLPLLQFIERHGIFCGNCDSLRIESNYIIVKRYSGTTYLNIDGIRVFGIIGRQMIVRQNHIVDPIVGVYFNPLNSNIENMGEPHPIWSIVENLSTGRHVHEAYEIGDRPQKDETAGQKVSRERRNAVKRALVRCFRNEP
ncbi:MAG: hypothetical protein JXA33_12545 [Anaerolineae bacterium]|nr:hypothetical protein [Anaerolineae bacterium]